MCSKHSVPSLPGATLAKEPIDSTQTRVDTSRFQSAGFIRRNQRMIVG